MVVKELNLELEHLDLVLIHKQQLPINEGKDDYSNRKVKQKIESLHKILTTDWKKTHKISLVFRYLKITGLLQR